MRRHRFMRAGSATLGSGVRARRPTTTTEQPPAAWGPSYAPTY